MTGGKLGGNGRLVVVFALLLATAGPALGASGVTDGGANSGSLGATGVGVATADSGDDGEPKFGDDAGSRSGDTGGSPGAEVAQQEPPDENNSTVYHRNPDEVNDDGNRDVEVRLSREMSGRLVESLNVSQQDRERAREIVGNDSEYERLAEQYGEATNEPGERDANQSNPFSAAGDLQSEFLANVDEYYETHEEYRQARSNNSTLRTRRLAHELERLTADVNRTAIRLNQSYANISSVEEAELQNATRTIGELRSNVTRTQMTVRNQTLVRTELSVSAEDPNGSFTDPVTLVGRLQTDDGEPIAEENVTLLVGNRTLDVTTDGEGRFQTEYRPTLTAVGERPREVEFRPANESVYLRENATARFGVRSVAPSVTISNRSATVRYNETLTVNGTVAADGVGVPDVPLVVTVNGTRVAEVRTESNGSFGATARLPANVSTGSQQVRVGVAPSDRETAIAPANGSAQFTVESMATSLSIRDVQTLDETAFVTGRLTTEDGEPLANRTVELRVDGTHVGVTNTNETGSYATSVTVPRQLLGGDTVRFVAVYAASGENLDRAQANATATVSSTGTTISNEQLRLGAAGLLGIAVLGVFVWRFRSTEAAPHDGETGGADARASEFSDARGRSTGSLLDSARTALADGDSDAAVVAAYAAARHRLENGVESGDNPWTESVDSDTPRTHWEFYEACREAGISDERLRRLEQLTETYERAAYAAESVSEADARETVELAESVRPEEPAESPAA